MGLIRKLPKELRPREKLLRLGAEALTDTELVASLLGTGTRQKDVIKVANEVVKVLNSTNGKGNITDLSRVHGVGKVKAIKIVAAQELFRRRTVPRGITVEAPEDILPYLRSPNLRTQEHFFCVSLNGAQELIQIRTVAIGLLDKVQIHPREVFADAITDRAAGVILAHNHPSQLLEPSEADKIVNQMLINAGNILGIQIVDHLIFNQSNYLSMRAAKCGGFE